LIDFLPARVPAPAIITIYGLQAWSYLRGSMESARKVYAGI
jgi:hypothetical protein